MRNLTIPGDSRGTILTARFVAGKVFRAGVGVHDTLAKATAVDRTDGFLLFNTRYNADFDGTIKAIGDLAQDSINRSIGLTHVDVWTAYNNTSKPGRSTIAI